MQLLFVKEKPQQEPSWKRCTESDIARSGKYCVGDWFKGKWKKDKGEKEELGKKHEIKVKDLKVVTEKLKQNILAKC